MNDASKLKNYSSSAALPNIFADIEKTLVSHGAQQIIKNYDSTTGKTIALSFTIKTPNGDLAIRLPVREDKVRQIFKNQGLRWKIDQPYRTSWATIRDWISAQMALIDWDMVKLEEVFLPYAVNKEGKTYFEVLANRGFQLGSGVEEGEVLTE